MQPPEFGKDPKQSGERLSDSEERFRLLVEGVKDYAIFMLDTKGHVTTWNMGAQRIKGYDAKEIIGEHFSIFYTEEDIERGYPDEVLRVAAAEGRYEEEGIRVRKDGSTFWANILITALRDAEGNLRGFAKVTRDITARKEAEERERLLIREQAEEDRARLAAIVESSDDIIIGKTLEGIITSWNKGAEKIYGYSAEEAVGQPISMLVPPERPNEIPRILESIRRGEKVDHFETVRMTKDGRRLEISLTVSPIRNSASDIVGASTIARDITERKRAKEVVRQAREAERQRIARDLHDGVLQDLSFTTAAIGLIQLDAEGTALEEELQRAIDATRSAARTLRAVVYDLRLADELDQPFPRLVESLVERSREMARGQQIGLEVKEGFPSEPLGGTGSELLRILQEALTNSRRHSGAKRVMVSLRSEGNDLVAEVSDDGRGLAPETVPGVGLRSMHERAASLGGTLEVESEPGNGTRVRLRVRMAQKG